MLFSMGWGFALTIIILVGLLVIFFGRKKMHQRRYLMIVEWGYLFLLVGCFGLLSLWADFSVAMLYLVVITGLCWLVEKFIVKTHPHFVRYPVIKHFVHYSQGFFIVLLVVFSFRSFIAEPFRIPSSSMRPGLIPGDFILVNKLTYGLRLPVINNVVLPLNEVKRGDVVVFNSPTNLNINFIKRVIGLPGDLVVYKNKVLLINGRALTKIPDGHYVYSDDETNLLEYHHQFIEQINNKSIKTLNNPKAPPVYINAINRHHYIHRCRYDKNGNIFMCVVPAGHYFVMGDNRDGSNDSRYWGFVRADMLVGKAFMIWMNFNNKDRIGQMIN